MLSSIAASTCDTAQLVARCCSMLASHRIATVLFGCCRGSPPKLRWTSTIFRRNITVKKSSFSFAVRSWTRFSSHTPKSGGTATAGSGAQVLISPRSPTLFTDTRRWSGQEQMSKCCTLGVLSFQSCSEWAWHHSLPRRETLREGKSKQLSHAKDLIHPCSAPAFCALHFSQNLCESDLWFLSGIWLPGYVSNKMKHGVYSRAPDIMDENSEVSSDGSERGRSPPDAKSPHCWRQWSLICLQDSRDHVTQSPSSLS